MSTQLPPQNSPKSSAGNSPAPTTPGAPTARANSQAPESTLAQITSLRLSQNSLISLGIGVVVGLVLGLLIGWVWWPVEWEGPSLGELNGPARATYLAAVADAYTQTGSTAALDTVRARLATLGAELPVQFDGAIRYYTDAEPPDRAAITNLITLAMALQLPLESVTAEDAQAVLGTTAQTTELPAATTSGAEETTGAPTGAPTGTGATGTSAASDAASSAASRGGSRWNWLWVILLGAVLVVGGVFVLRYVVGRKPAQPQEASTGTPGDVPKSTAPGALASSSWSSQTGASSGSAQAPGRTSPAAGQSAASGLQATIPPAAANTAVAGGASVSYLNPLPRSGPSNELAFTDEDMEGPEEVTGGAADAASTASSAPAAARTTGPGEVSAAPVPGDAGKRAASASVPAAAAATPVTTPAWAAPAGRAERYPALHSHTATFQLGLENFDFAKNIPNPAGAGFLGEYGMVIPERLGTVGNNLEQVVAIEVNLFDKTDETEIKTVTRFLLSEYAMDHLYDQFTRERRGVDPISAQPGTRFLLEGRQLLLDCVIREATFTPEHYFRKLTVEMTARRKTSS